MSHTVILDPFGLPRTGAIVSQYTGDDGALQAGRRLAATRAGEFLVVGNGTVIDRATGLTYVQQPEIMVPGPVVAALPGNQILSARGNWVDFTNTQYAEGDLVLHETDGLFYACIQANSLVEGEPVPTNAAYWRQTIWTASAEDLTTPAQFARDAGLDAIAALNAAGGYAGFMDWRMTDAAELYFISNADGTVNGFPAFPNWPIGMLPVEGNAIWSSTPIDADFGFFWHSNHYPINTDYVINPHLVMLVRGGSHL